MATIGGGVVLVGVRDDGTAVGAELGAGAVERLTQRILTGTDPRVFVDIDQPVYMEHRLLRIRVPAGDGPHLAFGRAYYRSGPATVAMSRDEYERRLLDRLRESSGFERRLERSASLSDLDPDAAARFCDLAKLRSALPMNGPGIGELLSLLHLGDETGIMNAGLLLFGKHPQRQLPQAVIRARAQRGAVEDSRSIGGTLLQQIEEVAAFVARNLKMRTHRDGLVRTESSELPPPAVREVIANAVAHRDYRSTAPIQLYLTDEMLEIWNPGHLPSPLTLASLRERHPSVPPNPFIARALYLAGYIEEWGTGTLRVIESMRAAGNPEVVFDCPGESGIRVVLPLPGAQPFGVSHRASRTLAKLSVGLPFRSADYAEAAGVSVRTAVSDLSGLERAGLVRRVGIGRATRWIHGAEERSGDETQRE